MPDGAKPFVQTAHYDLNDQLVSVVPTELILQHRFIPLKLDGDRLTVGMVDPFHAGAIAELDRVLHGMKVDVCAIGYDDFMATLARLRLDSGGRKREQVAAGTISYEKGDQEREADQNLGVIGNEVVGLVDKILKAGIERNASGHSHRGRPRRHPCALSRRRHDPRLG